MATHSFTTSQVKPIDSNGRYDLPRRGDGDGGRRCGLTLPASTIYGFNGVFLGPMINR